MRHIFSCRMVEGTICRCAELPYNQPGWPATPAGMTYGIDTRIMTRSIAVDWEALRKDSNFEVPKIRLTRSVARFPLATGKSKKLYLSALADAFIRADLHNDADLVAPGGWTEARAEYAYAAFERLLVQARRS